jgi:hypothetical protein
MASNTKLKWEQDLVEGLLEVVRNAARGQLKTTGPEPYLTKTDLRKLAYSLDEVKALVGQEFGSQVKTDPRSMWPFNDHTIKLSPNFEDVFRSILENDELKPRNDQKIKKLIKDAGGRPYNSKGYGGNDVGDAVVQPNKDVIATQIAENGRARNQAHGRCRNIDPAQDGPQRTQPICDWRSCTLRGQQRHGPAIYQHDFTSG